MTVVDFLRILRVNLVLIVVATILGGLLGWGYSALQPRVYVSSSTGYLAPRAVEGGVIGSGLPADQQASAYLALIDSPRVTERVARETGQQVAGTLSARLVDGSNLIRVTARSEDPQVAAALANSALQATADVALEVDPNATIDVVPLDDARVPTTPVSPNVRNLVLMGLAAGLGLGVAIALLRRLLDTRVRTTTDVQNIVKAGVMGVLPENTTLTRKGTEAVELDPRAGEAVRQLRTNLRFVSVDTPPRIISFTSANPAEGKSTVVASLARALAMAGERVLVVDADLRRPRQHSYFQVSGDVGLSEVLAGDIQPEDALVYSGVPGLYVLPAGRTPPNPSELLGSERMRALLKLAAQDYVVLVDSPPLLPVTDASLLATAVDGTVLVVRQRKTRKDHLEIARNMLGTVDARILGTVLNGVATKGANSHYYGAGYGYSSYQRSHEAYLDPAGSGKKKGRKRRGDKASSKSGGSSAA
ncbi:MAG: polysaccharide biosynthesis tyrosine autokinase [Micrococcus sp.]|nr:polysaccharide biosynthesis tyrosine autokinase [Micrococcus sp.]